MFLEDFWTRQKNGDTLGATRDAGFLFFMRELENRSLRVEIQDLSTKKSKIEKKSKILKFHTYARNISAGQLLTRSEAGEPLDQSRNSIFGSEVDLRIGEIWSQIQNLTFEKFRSIVLGAPEELSNFLGHFGNLYTSTLLVPIFRAIGGRTKKRRHFL